MRLQRQSNEQIITLDPTSTVGQGGEACVYAVPQDETLVAKVYHKPTSAHTHKLVAIFANPPKNPMADLWHIAIAWPIDLLRRVDGSDTVVGFLMPRVKGMHSILDFYNPKTRRQKCPFFNYSYLHCTFQVRNPENGVVYRCCVGKPEFTPLELQGKSFQSVDRAPEHDLFGLAVLMFQLLMEGTHPFSGIFQGIGDAPPYEARIRAGHFSYSTRRRVPYL